MFASPRTPFAAPAERPLFQWIRARAAGWMRQHAVRIFHSAEGTISPQEALAIINHTPVEAGEWLHLSPPDADLQADAALADIAARFALSPVEVAVIASLAAPALSVEIERLYRFLRNTHQAVTLGFVAELIEADAALDAVQPGAPLVRHGLVEVAPGTGQGRGIALAPDVIEVLRGNRPQAPWPWAQRQADPRAWPAQKRLAEAVQDPGTVVHVIGLPGTGRLAALTAALPSPPLCLDANRIELTPTVLQTAARVARLGGTRLVVQIDRPLSEQAAAAWARSHRLAAPIVLTQADVPLAPPDRRVVAPHLTTDDQATLWATLLGPDWAPDLPARLAQRFDLGPASMHQALAAQPRTEAELLSALRAHPPHRLGEYAQLYTTRMTWDDVILPDEVEETLRDIISCAQHQQTVLADWGFDRLLPYGRGLGCLFAGPPGTGKTMMAGILGNALGREVYRVDISKLVSKWLGETEKNLSALFEEARKAKAILFFDEADSLFAKRTGVKSSNDRHANMEVNHLLQRMERYDGVSILATNLAGSIDEAFKRRLRYVVHFELPDADARAALWAKMMPAQAPRAEGIRFERLGRHFKLTGGHIKNAVVRAAFLAAAAGSPITEALLVRAGEAETRAMGRL